MLCHPNQDRPLSVKEYARIQQFPDDWIFIGTVAAKYKQIGNAVPVGLAIAIGQAIIATADKTSTIQTKRFRGTSVHNKIKNAMEYDQARVLRMLVGYVKYSDINISLNRPLIRKIAFRSAFIFKSVSFLFKFMLIGLYPNSFKYYHW